MRSIRLYSSDDVEYLTKYLENATAKKAGDQPTNAELQKLRDNILSDQDAELDRLFEGLKITNKTRTQWCKEEGSIDNNEITESIKEDDGGEHGKLRFDYEEFVAVAEAAKMLMHQMYIEQAAQK